MRSIDDVIAAVDSDGVARDQLGTVKCEEENRLADVFDAHRRPCAFDSSYRIRDPGSTGKPLQIAVDDLPGTTEATQTCAAT